jgi:hypothetical protein
VPWSPPPPSFDRFLERLLLELPELRPVVEEQLAFGDGDVYSTSILDAASSAVMKYQWDVMEGQSTSRSVEIVDGWIALGEAAMEDAYVAGVFLETAGDDLILDPVGRSLYERLGPRLRSAVDERREKMRPPTD